ncbi:MAG: type IV pilus assembly protein PilM [Candidatus Stahlbacteria bacterium]|nr:type IV pilus assembly protein PilM [Candidatus Stahlbacteria bacterium]
MKTIKFKFPSIRKVKLPTIHLAKPNWVKSLFRTKIFDLLRRPVAGERRAVGLDIGTRYIKMVQLKKRIGGYTLEKYGLVELLPEIIVDREFMDRGALIENIRKIVESSGIDERKVSAVICGKNVISKKLLIKVPKKKKEYAGVIQSLAKENIPFDLKEVVIDTRKLKQEGENLELLLVGAKNEILYPLIDILKEVDLIPYTVDIMPFVLQSAYQKYIDKEGTYILINIGFEHILIVIIKDGYYFLDEEIPLGTRTFIEEIQRVCGVGADIAVKVLYGEKIKDVKEENVSKAIETTLKRIFSRLDRLLAEVHEYKTIVIGGGGAGISNIPEAFSKQFNTRCEVANPFTDIDCPKGMPAAPHLFDIAIGLAIDKLENTGVNLLPQEERVEERNKILQTLDQGLIFYSGVGSVVILGLVVYGLTCKQHRIEREIKDMTAQQEALTDKVKEVKELMDKEKDITIKVKVIQDLSKHKYERVKLLDEVNRLLPAYTWLVALNEKFADTVGIKILLRGITTSNFAVSDFMKNLETSAYFTDVQLIYTQRGEIGGTKTTDFEIQAQFKE